MFRNKKEILMIHFLLGALIGYCFGNINPAYIIARIRGFDIRKQGSGNAGASNVAIVIGKKAAVFTALFDIFKSVAANFIVFALFPELPCSHILGGAFCIIGHIFPVIMGFRGGKGLACLGGLVLAYDPLKFLLLLVIEVVIALALDYICIIPTTGSLLLMTIYALSTGDPIGTFILAVIAVIIMIKHQQNFLRIMADTEAHISFLWNKDKEIGRIRRNSNT